MKLIRITQEREALYELLPETNPDHYPWGDQEEDQVRFPPTNRDPAYGIVARWRWEEYCYENLQARSHRNYRRLVPRPKCYVCNSDPVRDERLYCCIICDDVWMCRTHAIFPACLPVRTPICCLHSRWTRGIGSWNPRGGYPYIPALHRRPLKEPELWVDARLPHDDEDGP
eukprot:6466807-Amphidinium_carterae.2